MRLMFPRRMAVACLAVVVASMQPAAHASVSAQPPVVCGNAIIDAGEACDDGNLLEGDGCSAACAIEQQCLDPGNTFSFFLWSDSYNGAGEGGVRRVFADVVDGTRYPSRVIPRFWISTGDIPFMADGPDRLDRINDVLSNSPAGQRYPFTCQASNGRFPYFVAVGNHDVDASSATVTPPVKYDYWANHVGPGLPTTLVGLSNFREGPVSPDGHDARTAYSFDYKNAHFVIVNQYFEDPAYPTTDPIACIRQTMMDWIDQDLAQSTKAVKLVFGHEPAWSYCSSLAGFGGSFCPAAHMDNQTPAFRPRPYSAIGDWTQPFGTHWGDSLEDRRCAPGSRDAFWQMLSRHRVIAHIVGHSHTYSGRLVQGDGIRRNDVPAYSKGGQTFTPDEGVWEISTAQTHTSAGSAYVLVTVRDSVVTFEAWDQRATEAYSLVESWSVRFANTAPALNPIGAKSGLEQAPIAFVVSATDTDVPANALTFSLTGAPSGAAIDPSTGAFTWTPTEGQGPGVYPVTVRVTDDGVPSLSSEETVTITVAEVNQPPALAPIGSMTVGVSTPLTFTAAATDADLPAQPLTYGLTGAPSGATINPQTGAFAWTPAAAGTFAFSVTASDNASPAAVASQPVTVTVTGGADVVTTAVSTTATARAPGATFTLSSTASNQGTVGSGGFVIAFHLSRDSAYGGADDVAMSQTRVVASLAGGAVSAGPITLTVPAGTALGDYHVCAFADPSGSVPETNRANNSRCATATLAVTRPDLTMTRMLANSTSVRRGNDLSVTETVRNGGLLSAAASVTAYRLSTNQVYGDADDVVINTTRSVGSLAASTSSLATLAVHIRSATPTGYYYVCGRADSTGLVTESNEDNNSRCTTARVQVRN